MNLICKTIPGPAHSRTGWIAALDHESIDDSMENHSVIKRFPFYRLPALRILPFLCSLSKPDKICNRVRRLLFEQLDGELSHRSIKMCISSWFHFSIVAFLM